MTTTLDELLRVEDPAWPQLRQWLAEARNPASILTTPRERGEATLYRLQVSAATTLGAMALYTAGVVVDHGWIRLLGAGGPPLGDGLREWNGLSGRPAALPGALIVAHDVLGGFFVVNAGALPGEQGRVLYRSARAWVELGLGYTGFVRWTLSADLDRFYTLARWSGWRDDVRALQPHQGFTFDPDLREEPLVSGSEPIEERERTAVPMSALWRALVPSAEQAS